MQRRGLLKLGVAGTALLAVAGGTAALWTPGLGKDGKLSPAGRLALGAIARAVLDGILGEDKAALRRQLDGFETAVAALPAIVREELRLLLSLTVNAPGRLGLLGSGKPLHELPRAELQQLLQAMRMSRLAMRQQAYFALRDLNCGAFVADPANSAAAMGYPGQTAIG